VTSSRRAFLRQTVSFSAALALGAARGARLAEARPHEQSDHPTQRRTCHLLAVGDFGAKPNDLPRQKAVGKAMAGYVARQEIVPDGLLLLGDNFYGGLGGRGVESPRWGWNVEDRYPA